MGQKIIGIGEYMISANKDDVLKTFALGSCVAVMIYDFQHQIGGMSHFALPTSGNDSGTTESRPAYYVDSGMPLLLKGMQALGSRKNGLWIKMAGGANTLNIVDSFDIGRRNVTAIKKFLWKLAMGPIKEDVGGKISRTVSLTVATGDILISSGPKKWIL